MYIHLKVCKQMINNILSYSCLIEMLENKLGAKELAQARLKMLSLKCVCKLYM